MRRPPLGRPDATSGVASARSGGSRRMTKITGIKTIQTRAGGNWVFVKVLTDQPGLYGIGSAHEHNPTGSVIAMVEQWIAPRLIGRDASQIEDIWQSTFTSGYWRTGPIHTVALAGVDI